MFLNFLNENITYAEIFLDTWLHLWLNCLVAYFKESWIIATFIFKFACEMLLLTVILKLFGFLTTFLLPLIESNSLILQDFLHKDFGY